MIGGQKLLFNETKFILSSKKNKLEIPQSFYSKGYILLDNIKSIEDARKTTETFIANINSAKLPFLHSLLPKIQLAKADLIPVCGDSVTTDFQGLHFDMGQPFFSQEAQDMYLMIGLFLPCDRKATKAKTRDLSLEGLFNNKKLNVNQVEEKIVKYVKKHGDGWNDVNTYRVSCLARLIDAISGTRDLASYRDKTMAQWFEGDITKEYEFYKLRGFDLGKIEEQIQLKPGQLLMLDNTTAADGRVVKRKMQEMYQMMFGVKGVSPNEINNFRSTVAEVLVK